MYVYVYLMLTSHQQPKFRATIIVTINLCVKKSTLNKLLKHWSPNCKTVLVPYLQASAVYYGKISVGNLINTLRL